MAGRRTVNGIKLRFPVDEATRKKIERAGTKAEQMQKAAELKVLDERHYKQLARILKRFADDFW
jgi:hypothetical protein